MPFYYNTSYQLTLYSAIFILDSLFDAHIHHAASKMLEGLLQHVAFKNGWKNFETSRPVYPEVILSPLSHNFSLTLL
jgi:hypothetical protein